MKALIGVTVILLFALTLMFVAAESFGFTDERRLSDTLEQLRHSRAGVFLLGPAIVIVLAVDLFLPIPSSILMTLSGLFYGIPLGTLFSFLGAMVSALAGYGLARRFGRKPFRGMIGAGEVVRVDSFLERYGVWGILLSRSVPMLTEVVSCVVGLGKMTARRFLLFSALGTLPLCIVYAWAGSRSLGAGGLGWPLLLAFVLPAAGFAVLKIARRQEIQP